MLLVYRKDTAHENLFSLAPLRPRASSAKLAALLLVAGAAIAVARPASAQTFKVTTTGTLTAIYGDGFNSSVQVGTPFTYSFLFDYSAPDGYAGPTLGQYLVGGSPYGATFTFGDYGFAPNAVSNAEIDAYYDEAHSFYYLQTKGNGETATGFSSPPVTSQVYAYGQLTNNSILSSDALPPISIYNLANFHNAAADGFFVSAVLPGGSDQTEVVGTATSLSAELVNPVPEASTTVSLGMMLGLGGLALGMRRRRKA